MIGIRFLLPLACPPVEIYAGARTTVGSVLKTAVPILAGVASVAVTVLKLAGVGAD